MSDIDETVVHRGMLGVGFRRYVVYEASPVNTDDTVTLDELNSITSQKCYRLDTGVEITSTNSSNIVTVTQSGLTNMAVVGIATGY